MDYECVYSKGFMFIIRDCSDWQLQTVFDRFVFQHETAFVLFTIIKALKSQKSERLFVILIGVQIIVLI